MKKNVIIHSKDIKKGKIIGPQEIEGIPALLYYNLVFPLTILTTFYSF
jgi:hypothetical protein